jgi:hypothetical protein
MFGVSLVVFAKCKTTSFKLICLHQCRRYNRAVWNLLRQVSRLWHPIPVTLRDPSVTPLLPCDPLWSHFPCLLELLATFNNWGWYSPATPLLPCDLSVTPLWSEPLLPCYLPVAPCRRKLFSIINLALIKQYTPTDTHLLHFYNPIFEVFWGGTLGAPLLPPLHLHLVCIYEFKKSCNRSSTILWNIAP